MMKKSAILASSATSRSKASIYVFCRFHGPSFEKEKIRIYLREIHEDKKCTFDENTFL